MEKSETPKRRGDVSLKAEDGAPGSLSPAGSQEREQHSHRRRYAGKWVPAERLTDEGWKPVEGVETSA